MKYLITLIFLINTPLFAFNYVQNVTADCEGGDTFTCQSVGHSYHQGRVIAQDDQAAIKYYKKACSDGYTTSCTLIGDIYKKGGNNVSQNDYYALEYYERACEYRNSNACYKLGKMYLSVKKDVDKAFTAYETGCKAGSGISCSWLSQLRR